MLRVITRLNVGGPAIHAGLLTQRLDADRFETLLVSGREGPGEGSMLELGRLDGLQPRFVASLGRSISPVADLRALLEVIAIVRAYRPDVVHTHLAKAGFIGRVAARMCGVRAVVHTYHGNVFSGYFDRWQTALYLWIERALARISTRLVAITPRQRDELLTLGIAPARKIVEIHLGLDLDDFRIPIDRLSARAALGLHAEGPIVGLVARLVPIKDVTTFLRAVAALRERVPGVRAVVVGDGEERGALEELATKVGLTHTCRFLGWRADMPNVYAALDVLALSSRNEGSPVSVIEAMAAGRPVVATRVGGVPDVVRDGVDGYLVSPADPAAMADALARLLTDEALRVEMGGAARAAVYPRFDASRLLGDVERLYLQLVDEVMT